MIKNHQQAMVFGRKQPSITINNHRTPSKSIVFSRNLVDHDEKARFSFASDFLSGANHACFSQAPTLGRPLHDLCKGVHQPCSGLATMEPMAAKSLQINIVNHMVRIMWLESYMVRIRHG